MKSLLTICAFIFSVTAFAQIPATKAITNLLPVGTHIAAFGEESCSVTIVSNNDVATVAIYNPTLANVFSVVNGSSNYSVNEDTGEFSAFVNLRLPGNYQSATKTLTIRRTQTNEVEVFIGRVYLDGQGQEDENYAACKVKLN